MAQIDPKLIQTPDWMRCFYTDHGASFFDIESVFNLGAGMIAVVDRSAEAEFLTATAAVGLGACVIGRVATGQGEAAVEFV